MDFPRKASCPCCLFPTLNDAGGFEVCVVCWWEDDGQNDEDADVVRGGPNSSYSLSQARRNFLDHGHMYNKGEGIEAVEHPSATRRKLIDYVESIGFDSRRSDAQTLAKLLLAEDRHIRKE